MKRFVVLIGCLAFVLPMTGCVNPKVKALEKSLSLAEVEKQTLENKLRELQDELAALRDMPAPRNQADLEKINNLIEKNKQLRSSIDALEKQINKIGAEDISITYETLPVAVDEALSQLAAANPGLMTYDKKRGMIKLANDVTFASGSAVVKSGATGALKQLASILNRSDVQFLDVVIVGHTDNVKISRPATKQKHPTNWHLSVHRAIGVLQILTSAGVSNTRVSAKGYGEYAPMVPNKAGGAEANRRVEIFLVKGGRAKSSGSSAGSTGKAIVPAKQPDPVDNAAQYK